MSDRLVLPKNVVPLHYDLHLSPDLERASFNGTVTISLAIKKATSVIVLNARDLELLEAAISFSQGKTEQQ